MESLDKFDLSDNPIESFCRWHTLATKEEDAPDAFALATTNESKVPRVRYLLYKGVVGEELSYYSHYDSPKGIDLKENPIAEMAFYWPKIGRQVRVLGPVTRMSEDKSKEYFYSRPFESQVASYISHQSRKIESRDVLETKYREGLEKYQGKTVPYDGRWGGYLLSPSEVEFFLYGEFRLNDRLLFLKEGAGWNISRVQP